MSCARRRASRGCSPSRDAATKRAQRSPKIYNWFAEGFDTVDQKDAKALLEELTAQHAEAGCAARTAKQEIPGG